MGAVHLGVVLLAVGANGFSAVADFLRLDRIRVSMERVGVPTRILPLLGVPKAAAVVGLPAGFLAVAVAVLVTAPG